MSEQAPPLLEFPCEFPIKAVGLSHDGLQQLIIDIVRRHASDVEDGSVTSRRSGGGKYTAVTITIQAQSKQQLDAIYRDLKENSAITMVL
jgi:hypothetical protein